MPGVVIDETIRRAARHLADHTRAEAVVLFGSRARGDGGPDSDWDLCVVLPDHVAAGVFTPVSLWREVSGFGLPIQVYPVRRSVLLGRAADVNSVSHDVLRDGVPLVGSLPAARGQSAFHRCYQL